MEMNSKDEYQEVLKKTKQEYEVEEAIDVYSEQKSSAIQVDLDYNYGNTLDAAIKTLEDYKARGESVYIDFNGNKLYSCDVTVDGVYLEVIGMTKKDFEEEQEKRRKEYVENEKRQKEEAMSKVPGWIERGSTMIFPEKLQDWQEYVENSAEDLYHGNELEYALEIMEELDSGASIEKVLNIFEDKNYSGISKSKIIRTVLHFSKRGPEFYENTAKSKFDAYDKEILEEQKKENEKLAAIHDFKEAFFRRRQEEKEIKDLSNKRKQLVAAISSIENQILDSKKGKKDELDR